MSNLLKHLQNLLMKLRHSHGARKWNSDFHFCMKSSLESDGTCASRKGNVTPKFGPDGPGYTLGGRRECRRGTYMMHWTPGPGIVWREQPAGCTRQAIAKEQGSAPRRAERRTPNGPTDPSSAAIKGHVIACMRSRGVQLTLSLPATMNENTEPQKHIEAARMQLISPPPEEELQRTHVFGFPRTNTNTAMAQTKRKRASGVTIGSPSKTSAEPVEATPNPKPRKAHRRRTSTLESPSRPSFAHAHAHANPNADYVPPVTLTAPHGHGRRSASVTPYEPPPDVFTPPREVLLALPPLSTRKAAPKQKTKEKERTATPRARTQTPLRVVVHSVKKEPPPSIDRTRPMTPPSPTDDPLLLLPSLSPVKATHIRKRSVPVPTFDEEDEDGVRSSDAAYAPIDWTAGLPLDLDAPDAPTSDSMDIDMDPASFDGPLPVTLTLPLSVPLAASADYDYDYDANANAGWDSSDDDEGGDADALPTTTTTALGPTSSLNSLPGASPTPAGSRGTPTRTSTRIRSATPTISLLPPFSLAQPMPTAVPTASMSTMATLPTTPATTTPSLILNNTNSTTNNTNANLQVADFLHPTKPDPLTLRTRTRAEAWGVWGSPWPGRPATPMGGEAVTLSNVEY
ncbi:hypothetical protein C8R45DRAFT_1189232 [Mycena sanguinolenta]|nr:hypothetical protein C8R45DRAFT_1189232 [Mycena sanguinolenta]